MADPLLFEGLGALAQGFLAGRQAKQEREYRAQELALRKRQMEAEAAREERLAKQQEVANRIAALGLGQRAFQEGVGTPELERVVRETAGLPTIIEQKAAIPGLAPAALPAIPPAVREQLFPTPSAGVGLRIPQQFPEGILPQIGEITPEREQALQRLQIISDQSNRLAELPIPEDQRQVLQDRLETEKERAKNIAFGVLERGGVGMRVPTEGVARPAAPSPLVTPRTITRRAPTPSLFQAPPAKPLKPEEDPLIQTQKEVELNFRSGRMAPEEMQKYYKLKAEYQRTSDKNAFLQGLQTLRFRERPVTEKAGTGAAEQRAKFNLLLGYQDFVHTTEMDNDRIEDNKRAKEKEITDIQKELSGLESAKSAQMVNPKEYTERKAEITKRLNRANDEIRAFDLKIIKNLKQAQTTTKSMNQLEKEVGLPGEFEAKQAEDTRTERARNFLDEQGYETDDESIRMFLQNNPDFE